jgi:hypothetical protein
MQTMVHEEKQYDHPDYDEHALQTCRIRNCLAFIQIDQRSAIAFGQLFSKQKQDQPGSDYPDIPPTFDSIASAIR